MLYLTIDHHDLKFQLVVHSQLWTNKQSEIVQQVSMQTFLADCEKFEKNSDIKQMAVLQHNAGVFTKEAAERPDSNIWAYQTIVRHFPDKNAVASMAHSVLMSSVVAPDVVYRSFIDGLTMFTFFANMDGLNPCPFKRQMMN